MSQAYFGSGYLHGQGAELMDRERLAVLNAPSPRNDPKLLAEVKVRCVVPFYALGRALEVGEVVSIEEHVARDMVALGRAERC